MDLESTIENPLLLREKALIKMKNNIDNAQKMRMETYIQKHLAMDFPIGAKILLENTPDKPMPRRQTESEFIWSILY